VLNGGFGDHLDVSEVIAAEEAWLARTSRFLVPVQDPDCEDVAQEGRIAMWKAAEKYDPSKGPLDMWLKAHARWRMKSVRGNRSWTGNDARPTLGGRESVVRSVAYLSDLLTDDNGIVGMLEAADLLSGIEWAYHHGEIAVAMAELTPRQREYVFLRFWVGYQLPQMRDYFGYDPQGLWSSPKNGAKTRLRARLSHLVAP
jgi:DNA-directed RNA polymerase specialized sigma24 family protein